MKTCAWTLTALVTSVAFADSLAPIGWRETGGVIVGSGETSNVTSRLTIADKGTFVKAGAGELNLPAAALEKQSSDARYAVLSGKLTLTTNAVAESSLAVPSVLTEKAAFWISAAAESDSTITLDGANVVNWYDARETGVGGEGFSPKYPYMTHACVSDKTDQQQSKAEYMGHRAVHFGGYAAKGKGGYMRLKSATGADASAEYVFHAYFVHGIETCMGTVLGHTVSPSDFMMAGGNLCQLGTSSYYYYRADTTPAVATARHYRNGSLFDPFHTSVAKTFELVEADFADRPTVVDSLYNNRCVDNRQGGDYLSEAVVFTNRLTEAERLSVERYLIAKWNLAAAVPPKNEIALSENASVEMPVGEPQDFTNHYPVVFRGAGEVVKSGARRFVVGPGMFADFDGLFDLAEGNMFSRFDEFPAIAPRDGRTYTTTVSRGGFNDVANGTTLAQASGTAGTIAKDGIEDVAFTSVPNETKCLEVQGGTLALVGRKGSHEQLPVEGCVRATFPNADAEAEQIASPSSNRRRHPIASGKTFGGWTFVGVNSYTGGYLVAPLLTTDGRDWVYEIQQGRQALYIFSNDGKTEGSGTLYTTVDFPVAGEYLVSWREMKYYPGTASPYSVLLGTDYANARPVMTRMAADGCFPRVYVKLVVPEAGPHCFGIRADWHHSGYYALAFDDFRADFVACPDRAQTAEIPNGDFEETLFEGMDYGKSVIWHMNKPTGWTIYNGDGWTADGTLLVNGKGDSVHVNGRPVIGLVSTTLPVQAPQWSGSQIQPVQSNARFSRHADEVYGSQQLFFCGSVVYPNAYAQTTFTVARPGTYRLRGKVSRWNVSYLDVDFFGDGGVMPKMNAKVSVGGTEYDLGELVGDSHLLADRAWGGTFTVTEENAEVTLTLRQTVAKAACLVDDLVLVDDSAPALARDEELIANGSFEHYTTDGAESVSNERGWTIAANPSVTSQTVSFWKGVGNGRQYTTVPYDGQIVCHIRGACTLSQQLPKMAKGRYRFRVAGNTRSNANYDKNGIRVTLNDASGNEKYVVFEQNEITNYEAKVFTSFVDVTEEAAYKLVVKGTHAETWAGGGDRGCVIDGLSLKRDYGERTIVPSVPNDLRITVAEGAKLNLDFKGKITVRTLRLGGTGCIGTVSAVTHPDYITGDGEIEVEPHGTVLIFR